MDPLTLAASATAEELTFQCGNDKELRAKFWKTGGDVPASERRRFIALHGFMDNAGSFDPYVHVLIDGMSEKEKEKENDELQNAAGFGGSHVMSTCKREWTFDRCLCLLSLTP